MTSREATRDGLMTPSEFGSLTLLSAKALRIYADRGLLPPYWVNSSNGYRYYHASQAQTGWLIALLRSADLPLPTIGEVLQTDVDSALALLDRWESSVVRRTEATKAVLERARHHLRKDSAMPDITTELVPSQEVLSLIRRLQVSEIETVIRTGVRALRGAADAAGLEVTGDPFGIFHAPVDGDSTGPLDIALPVDGLTDLTGDLRSYRLPGGWVASRHAVGEETHFPAILARYDEVCSWIDQAGYTPIGPPGRPGTTPPTTPSR